MAYQNRYDEITLLFRGTGGVRYKAKHRILGFHVFIQEFDVSLSVDQREKLIETIRSVAGFGHPNIAPIIDAEFDIKTPYFVSCATNKMSLQTASKENKSDLVRWSLNLLEALYYAHRKEISHYGLTPDRLVIDSSGGLQITEFGVASCRLNKTLGYVELDQKATPYLPPKVLRDPRRYDSSTDRYCAAAIIVELLTGKIPNDGADIGGNLIASAHAVLSQLLSGHSSLEALAEAIAVFEAWWKSTVVSGARSFTGAFRAAKTATNEHFISAFPDFDEFQSDQTQISDGPDSIEETFFDDADNLIDDAFEAVSTSVLHFAEDSPLFDNLYSEEKNNLQPSSNSEVADRIMEKLNKYAYLLDE